MSMRGFLGVTHSLQTNLLTLISLRGGGRRNRAVVKILLVSPSPAFLLPFPCLLMWEEIVYVSCSLLHYVICTSRNYFHCVLKLISLCFFPEWIMKCPCTSATCRIYGVLIWAFLVEGHRQLRFDTILTPHVC